MNVLRRFALVFTLVFAVLFVHAESPAKLSKPTTYVSDFAGVLDDSSKQTIEDLATQIYIKAHATIVVVTVDTLDGEDIESWTTDLEDRWKVGPKGSDKGVVLVFAVQDHKDRIEVGYGLEGILNDAKVGDILRSIKPGLQESHYGPAIQSAVQQVGNVIATDANVTLTQPQPPERTYQYAPTRHHSNWVGIVIFIVILLIISRGGGGGGGRGWLWFLLGSMMGGGGGRGGGGFGDGGGGGNSGGGDFGGGFGGGSGGGGASGDW